MRLATLALSLLVTSAATAAEPAATPDSPPAAAPPKGTTVLCTIRSPGESGAVEVHFDGPCRFLGEKGGSFSLSALDGDSALYEGILDVSVTIVAPGKAEVRGLTELGINSRWGEARRSKKDPACWVGSGFEICARRKP
jgi:hypothetical protein